jgi:hypothetical protein
MATLASSAMFLYSQLLMGEKVKKWFIHFDSTVMRVTDDGLKERSVLNHDLILQVLLVCGSQQRRTYSPQSSATIKHIPWMLAQRAHHSWTTGLQFAEYLIS